MVKRNASQLTRYLMLLLFSINCISNCLSQNESRTFHEFKNELSVNAAFILWGYSSISYERNLYRNISVGLDAGRSLFSFEVDISYNISPYARLYIPIKRRSSFFIELLGTLADLEDRFDDEEVRGLGTALGWKFLGKKNLSINIVLGVTANYLNESGEYQDLFPRAGIYIGRRF